MNWWEKKKVTKTQDCNYYQVLPNITDLTWKSIQSQGDCKHMNQQKL